MTTDTEKIGGIDTKSIGYGDFPTDRKRHILGETIIVQCLVLLVDKWLAMAHLRVSIE